MVVGVLSSFLDFSVCLGEQISRLFAVAAQFVMMGLLGLLDGHIGFRYMALRVGEFGVTVSVNVDSGRLGENGTAANQSTCKGTAQNPFRIFHVVTLSVELAGREPRSEERGDYTSTEVAENKQRDQNKRNLTSTSTWAAMDLPSGLSAALNFHCWTASMALAVRPQASPWLTEILVGKPSEEICTTKWPFPSTSTSPPRR